MRLILVRHGQAEHRGNEADNLYLTDLGKRQVEALGQWLADNESEVSSIICSPLRRAVATAEPLCKAAGIRMQLKDGLKEIAYGQWEGKTPDAVNREFHDDYVRWLSDPGWHAPTGGERGIDIARRGSRVIEEIEQAYNSGNVLVVSHKATIRIMLCSLIGIDVGRFRDRISMPVAAVSIVEMASQGPFLRMIGDRSHLREPLRNREGS